MIDVSSTRVIAAPIEDVFGLMSDIDRLPEWLVGCREAWALTDDPNRVGGRVAHIDEVMGQRFEAHYEVVEWRPEERLVFKSLSGPFDGRSEERFESEGDSTRVSIRIVGGLRGAMKATEWVAKRVAANQLEESLDNAQQILETAKTSKRAKR